MKQKLYFLFTLFWCSILSFGQSSATHLNFDGINDLVNLGNGLTTHFTGRNSITIEAWVKPETTTGNGVILGNFAYPTTLGNMQVLLRRDGANYVFFVDGGTGFTSVAATNAVQLNTWQHVAATWNGTSLFIYINGALINFTSKTGTFPSRTNSFAIGSNANNDAFKGSIEELRVWNVARTNVEIDNSRYCELKGNEFGLVAYYKFNQGFDASDNTSISTLNDFTTNYNATLNNFALTGSTSNFLAGSPVLTTVLPTATAQSFCGATTANSLVPAISSTIRWYDSLTGTIPLIATDGIYTGTYYVESVNTNGCVSARIAVSITITNPYAPTVITPQIYAGTGTVANLTATGTNLQWFTTQTGGAALVSTEALVDGTTYYVSQTVNSCESPRAAVIVRKISETTQTLCEPATVANLISTPTTGATAQWFTSATSGTAIANTTTLTSGTYYIEQNTPLIIENLSSVSTAIGVAIQPDGKILVTENFYNRVRRMNSNGTGPITLGTGFNKPNGIAIQSDGKILVADTNNNAIKRMNTDGTGVVTLINNVNANQPKAVAVQADGKILFSDNTNGRVKRSRSNGTFTTTLGQTYGATALTQKSDGKILLVDNTNYRLVQINANGIGDVSFYNNDSYGLAIQADGKFIITNTDNSVRRLNEDGTYNATLLTGLYNPKGIAIQPDGKILVAEYDLNVLRRFTLAYTSNRVAVNVIVNQSPTAPTAISPQVYAGNATIASLTATGTNLQWYAAVTGGTALASTEALVDNTTYYVSQTVNGCESLRTAVTVRKISEATQMLPPASTVANLVATPSTGATAQWFTAATGGTALSSTDVLTNGVYYVEQNTPASTVTLRSGFNTPIGVAIQADGKIVVADFDNSAIKRMDADGANIVTLGSGFSKPTGVAIQADGKIVVSDFNNSAVKRMDANGTNIVTLGSGFSNPSGVAIQADDKILVADYLNNVIKRMDVDGANIITLGIGFTNPTEVAIQADGKIVVADFNHSNIKRMDADGANIITLGSGFSNPSGVAIQADDKILVVDTYNNAIKRMDADGSNIVTLGSGFSNPRGVAIQADGKIVVADSNNNAIKRITEASTSNRVPVNVDVTTLSISNFDVNSFKIYPNPSTGIFNISAQENVTIEVYDLVGKQIKMQEVSVGTSSIDISNYASGVYLLKATNTKGAVNNYKLIKQ